MSEDDTADVADDGDETSDDDVTDEEIVAGDAAASTEERAQVCPNCGSTDVHVSRENVTDMLGLEHEYTCHNCGFTSKLFPEVPLDRLEEYEDAFEAAFEERYMAAKNTVASLDARQRRIVMGGLVTVIGIAAIPWIGYIPAEVLAVAALVAGTAIIFYEWQDRNDGE